MNRKPEISAKSTANKTTASKSTATEWRGRRALPKLSDEQRAYIIRRLAADHSPTVIQREVRERFGIALRFSAITYYDPPRVPTPKKRWTPLFHAARRARTADQAALTGEARQIERLARRIVEVLEGRVLDGFDVARAVAITEEDRLRALKVFVARLAVSNPAGLAEIRRALDAPGPHGAAAAATREPGEARHAA
jgi:hypothetical protein